MLTFLVHFHLSLQLQRDLSLTTWVLTSMSSIVGEGEEAALADNSINPDP